MASYLDLDPADAGADRHVEWLAEHTGRVVWLEQPDGTGAEQPETNWMARAGAGDVTGGYIRTTRRHAGLTVWARQQEKRTMTLPLKGGGSAECDQLLAEGAVGGEQLWSAEVTLPSKTRCHGYGLTPVQAVLDALRRSLRGGR